MSARLPILSAASLVATALPAGAQPAARPADAAVEAAEIVVTGFRAQNERAIDAKRRSEIVAEFLKSDDIGQQPDYNIADSFRRLPGVQTVFDEDEGRYVSIRGLNPSFTIGSFDGATMATAERGNRQLNMEAIPSTAVAGLEVLKSRTPDMEGNAIGGSVNLVSRSAFDRPGLFVIGNVFIGVSDSQAVPGKGFGRRSDDGPNVRFDGTLTTRFGRDDLFGLALSGSFSRKRRDQERLLPQAVPPATGPTPAPPLGTTNLLWSTYPNSVDRYGGTAKLEARPSPELALEASYTYFSQDDNELRHSQQLLNTSGGSFVRFNDFPIRKPLHVAQARMSWESESRHRVAGRLSYSRASFLEPSNEVAFNLLAPAATFDLALVGGVPIASNITPRFDDPAQYRFTQYRPYKDDSTDEVLEGQLDWSWNTGGSDEGFGLGAGLKYRDTTRDNARTQEFYNPATGTNLLLSQFLLTDRYRPIFGNFRQLFVDFDGFLAFFRANPGLFRFDPVASDRQSIGGDWVFKEEVTAAYGLVRHRGPRHAIIAGLRFEDTATRSSGFTRRTVAGRDEFTPFTRRSGYDDLLPSVTGFFDVTDRFRVRAAFFQAVGRPNPNQVAGPELLNADGSISRSNPDLRRRRGGSYEASLEYYLPESRGLLAAAVFHKKIRDEIFTFTAPEVIDGATVSVNQPRNAEDAKVTGVELNAIVNRLWFLPGFLADFGAQGNLTVLDGSITIRDTVNRRRLDQLPGQADFLANAAIFYESGPVQARVSYAHIGAYKTAVNASNPAADRTEAPFDQVDAQARIRVSPRIEVIGEIRNLTNAERLNLTGPNQDIARDINRFGRQFWIGAAFGL
ncbi:MAG: TonB-dependent receptor [Thermaurantiacus tibetensis]|uniref:TonB-dependent receptor n=1 Tax=Thermaurantiacus tibetensis TaxID=2759035 RepID=UPI00188E5793|nr:TonB-dependent receptor [Thermaurantiacus tibetensis]